MSDQLNVAEAEGLLRRLSYHADWLDAEHPTGLDALGPNARASDIRALAALWREERAVRLDDAHDHAFEWQQATENLIAHYLKCKELRDRADHFVALYREAVEALDDIVSGAGLEFSDPRVSYETWQLDPGSIEKGRAVLAKARAALEEKE